MGTKVIEKKEIRRLEIAGLYALSYFGYALHMIIHNVMAHGLDRAKLSEMAATMEKPSILAMFFIWNIVTILPAFLAFVLRGRQGWWLITVLGALVMAANGWHSIAHLTQGDLFNGANTFVMQMIPLIWAVVWSFTHARSAESE